MGQRQITLADLLPRHRAALTLVCTQLTPLIESLALALKTSPSATTAAPRNPEAIADTLRAALDSLSELTGYISPDDVIGRVFATFCVGK